MPGIIRWPGKTTAGQHERRAGLRRGFSADGLCQSRALPRPSDRKLDGASLLPLLSGGKIERSTPLYWHFNHAFGGPLVALRSGDWKILATLDKEAFRGTAITRADRGRFQRGRAQGFSALQPEGRHRREERPRRRAAGQAKGNAGPARRQVPRGPRRIAHLARLAATARSGQGEEEMTGVQVAVRRNACVLHDLQRGKQFGRLLFSRRTPLW